MCPHIRKGKKEKTVAETNQRQLTGQGPVFAHWLIFKGKLIFNPDNPFNPPGKISGHAPLEIGLYDSPEIDNPIVNIHINGAGLDKII
jgi:hypothetical protein